MKHAAPHDSDAWAAFEGEVLPHADRLFRLAIWFERNRADAEDVVQETMMQALRSFHRFQPGTNCRAWLTTILQHIVSNRRRAKGRSIVVDDPDDRISSRSLPNAPCLGIWSRPARSRFCEAAEYTHRLPPGKRPERGAGPQAAGRRGSLDSGGNGRLQCAPPPIFAQGRG